MIKHDSAFCETNGRRMNKAGERRCHVPFTRFLVGFAIGDSSLVI